MKKTIYLFLFFPFTFFCQTQNSTIDDVVELFTEANPPIQNNLLEGWNMFGYPCLNSINVSDAFYNHSDNIQILKDNNGAAYLPQWNFNGVGDLQPGQGYQICLLQPIYDFSFCDGIIIPNIQEFENVLQIDTLSSENSFYLGNLDFEDYDISMEEIQYDPYTPSFMVVNKFLNIQILGPNNLLEATFLELYIHKNGKHLSQPHETGYYQIMNGENIRVKGFYYDYTYALDNASVNMRIPLNDVEEFNPGDLIEFTFLTTAGIFTIEEVFDAEFASNFNQIQPAGCNQFQACPYPNYLEYDSLATYFLEDCCINFRVLGCTNANAINYDSLATLSDESCEFIEGCTYTSANNYDSLAVINDESCEFIEGCTYTSANNYDSLAVINDGSCDFTNTDEVLGCGIPFFINYDTLVTTSVIDSCIVEYCSDSLASNTISPLTSILLQDTIGVPMYFENNSLCKYSGCIDEIAENYSEIANVDDGSCTYIYGCQNSTASNYNPTATRPSPCEIHGCTLDVFPNYNPAATIGNGTCDMNSNDIYGCLDSLSLNYNELATTSNGTCFYGPIPQVGEQVHGGIVFYVDETGQHGLVTAMEDLVGYYEWGCNGTSILGADGQSIGTGYQNTLDIVEGCLESNTAAFNALNSTVGGYTDWYLPSFDELYEMYNTIGNGGPEGNIGGFSNTYYWSSSEYDKYTAWDVNFNNGSTYSYYYKYNTFRVRVIRAF
jgi:hypothetical protein